MSNIPSNCFFSDLGMAFRNGFHSAFCIASVILNDGTVLPIIIIIKIQGLHKWELALKGERERGKEESARHHMWQTFSQC
jgi:hypothetical protein